MVHTISSMQVLHATLSTILVLTAGVTDQFDDAISLQQNLIFGEKKPQLKYNCQRCYCFDITTTITFCKIMKIIQFSLT